MLGNKLVMAMVGLGNKLRGMDTCWGNKLCGVWLVPQPTNCDRENEDGEQGR